MRNTLIICALISCISINSTCKSTTGKKTAKENALAILDTLHDPYVDKIPDSMKYLVKIFDTMFRRDQQFRDHENSELYFENLKQQDELDSLNVNQVLPIIKKYGWLDRNDIGMVGEKAMVLVMVHSRPEIKKTFYPFMIDALKAKKIRPFDFAMFEDKLNVMTGRQQYYGTQVTVDQKKNTLFPVMEPDSLETRRRRMYLMPEGEYLEKNFKVNWDLEEYKRRLPELKKIFKTNDSASYHFEYDAIKTYGY